MGMKFSALIINKIWSKTTLNYWMMVEGYPNLKEEVGGSDPGCEISSLPDRELAKWSTASCALALACRPFVSNNNNNNNTNNKYLQASKKYEENDFGLDLGLLTISC